MTADTISPCTLPHELVFREYGPCDDELARPSLHAARGSLQEAIDHSWLQLTIGKGGDPQVIAAHFVGLVPIRCAAAECAHGGEHLVMIKPKGDRAEGLGGLLRFLDLALLQRPEKAEQGYAGRAGAEKYVSLAWHFAELLRDLGRRDFRR